MIDFIIEGRKSLGFLPLFCKEQNVKTRTGLMRKLWVIFILFGFLSQHCSQQELDENTLAMVDGDKISTEDILRSVEERPGWAPSKKGEEFIRAHLQLLVEKYMFYQEAQRRGFHKDRSVMRIVNWFREEELRKVLFEEEIGEELKISEQELQDAFAKENMQLHVRHLFARTENEITEFTQALNDGIPWENIARVTFRDSILAATGGDLGWLGYGQMEPAFEDTAYSLKIGQISKPVLSKYGYHLIQVLDVRKKVFAGESELNASKNHLENMLFRKKSQALSKKYIKEFMDEKNVTLDPNTFNLLVEKIRDYVIDARSTDQNIDVAIRDAELDTLSLGLENYLDEVLITFSGGNWTVAEFLQKFYDLPSNRRPSLASPIKFHRDLGKMIRDDLLAQEAKERGLEKNQKVREETKYWQNEFSFSKLWQTIEDTISVSEEAAESYFEKHKARYWWPERVHVQEIFVKTEDEARLIINKINQGDDFAVLAKKYSLRTNAAQKGGDLGWLAKGQMGNISREAFNIQKGDISRPIKSEGGYSIVKALGKKKQQFKSFEEAQQQVLQDLRRTLRGDVYQQWVLRLTENAHIQVNDSLVTKLGKEFQGDRRVVMPMVQPVY